VKFDGFNDEATLAKFCRCGRNNQDSVVGVLTTLLCVNAKPASLVVEGRLLISKTK